MYYVSALKFHATVSPFQRVIVCSDEPMLGALYIPYLAKVPLHVVAQGTFAGLFSSVLEHRPHIVLACITDTLAHVATLRTVRQAMPALHVVTTGLSLDDSVMRSLMAIGVSGHVDRMLSRPRDVAIMVEQLFDRANY